MGNVFPDRGFNATIVFPDIDAPDSFKTGILVTQTMSFGFMPFYVVAMYVVARSIKRRLSAREPGERLSGQILTLYLLLANLFREGVPVFISSAANLF